MTVKFHAIGGNAKAPVVATGAPPFQVIIHKKNINNQSINYSTMGITFSLSVASYFDKFL